MNGRTYAYLDIAALPAVGELLLDARPAFVFRGDGSAVLWANAAGVAYFDETTMAGLLARRFATSAPLSAQIARLAKQAPADRPRMEMLRFAFGVRQESMAALCRRLLLPGDTNALLVVAAGGAARESAATRAERLADVIAADDCLAAVLDGDGKVLGASGGFESLLPATEALDALVERVRDAERNIVKQPVVVGSGTRPAGIARIRSGTVRLFLLIVGPEDPALAGAVPPSPVAAAATPPAAAVAEPLTAVTEPVPPEPGPQAEVAPPAAAASATAVLAAAPAEPHGRDEPAAAAPAASPSVRRFFWQTDADARFAFVSADLAAVAGDIAGSIAGRRLAEVAAHLGLDPDGTMAAAFARRATFASLVVRWPTATGERLGVALDAMPVSDRAGAFAGFRGIGTIRLDDGKPGEALAPWPAIAPAEVAAPPVESPAPPEPPAPPLPEAAVEAAPLPVAPPAPEPTPAAPILAVPEPEAAAAVVETPPIVTEEPATAEASPPAVETPPAADVPAAPAAPEPARAAGPAAPGDIDIDDLARRQVEEGAVPPPPRPAAADAVAAAPVAGPPPQPVAAPGPRNSNVVRLPGTPTRALPRRLTGSERDAFRRIAEELGVRPATAPAAEEVLPEAVPEDAEPPKPVPVPAIAAEMQLLDRLPVGVLVHRDGRTLAVNRAFLELLGHASAEAFEAAGGVASVFVDGRADDAVGSAGGCIRTRRADGTTVSVAARLHAVPWDGASALMLTLAEPASPAPAASPASVAEAGRAAEAARAAEAGRAAELETILDTATDGVIVIDRAGSIVTFSRAAEALFGITAGEVAGHPFTDLLAEESRRAALDYLDGLAANGVASVLNDGREVIGRVPAGGLIPLFMTMGRLGSSGKYCAVLRDITHWKNVEEELVAARRAAEAANAQKSEFLAKISHEIRTPLNAIIGFSEVMMEERFGPIGNDRYRAYLRDIHVSGAHVVSLINDLLDLSKIEAGKLELKFEAVGVNESIQECVALMQPQANRERIIIRTSLAEDVPNVVADVRAFRQILLNLLSNAIKFTQSGGQVIVATALEENGEVVVRIRDTGIGMTEKDIETAMKPFKQIATSGRQREGTGLGLPLTKALVEANRATFAIDSVPKQGTLVRITFPTTRVLAG